MKTLKDFDVTNKRVLVRADFNVPLDEKGNILDDFRIKQTLPTIKYLIEKGAKITLISHLGRPGGIPNPKYSLKPVALKLEELLERRVEFAKEGEITLLENLRFHKEEEENDENFARELAKSADIYINDAFGTCHRPHASIVSIPKYLPSGAGLLLEKEIKVLSHVLEKPRRPLIAIIGGIKISTKIKLIEQLLEKADHLLLGGEIANVILRAKGICIGKPLPEPEVIEKIKKLDLTSPKLHLPVDGVISLEDIKRGLEEGYIRQAGIGTVRKEEKAYDIGPETIRLFSEIIRGPEVSFWRGPLEYIKRGKAPKTILWNGPLGFFENEKFERGTREIANAIVRNYAAFKIAGGGDTDAALYKFGLRDKFDHVSTGGGAMLAYLSGEKLPGLEAFK